MLTPVRLAGIHVPAAETSQRRLVVLAASFGMAAFIAVVSVIGLNSALTNHPAASVALRAVLALGLALIAIALLYRGSNLRLAVLLVMIACAFILTGLTAADSPALFAIGRVAVPVSVLLILYFTCAYPRGRIEERSAQIVFGVCAVVLIGLAAASLLLSDLPPVTGPFLRCSGTECPTNPFNLLTLGSGPSDALQTALGLATSAVAFAGMIVIVLRTGRATRLQRRTLMPVCVWNVVAATAYGSFIAIRSIDSNAELLETGSVVVIALLAAMPLAIVVGIARGRLMAMTGLERMIAGLGQHPTVAGLQQTMSRAFADPSLELGFWRPSIGSYVDIAGNEVTLSGVNHGRVLTRFDSDGRRVAVAVHDPALSEDRELFEAAGTAVCLAFENAQLKSDLSSYIVKLEASRKRVAWAADDERRRIEQNLHDGAQHDLVALRIRLNALESLTDEDPEAVSRGIADAGRRIDRAIGQIRNLAKGIYPSVLTDMGLSAALSAVARDLPVAFAMPDRMRKRFAPEVESAVYFCCVEALQNVVKHCGPDVRATVRLQAEPDGLRFAVADDGPGFDAPRMAASHGLTSMRDRLEVIGGELTIASSVGAGTTVSGTVPAIAI